MDSAKIIQLFVPQPLVVVPHSGSCVRRKPSICQVVIRWDLAWSCFAKIYLIYSFGVYFQYMRSFHAAATTSQPVLTPEDIDSIFYKIPELHAVHTTFIHQLQPKIQKWGPEQEVANAFKVMVGTDLFRRDLLAAQEEVLTRARKFRCGVPGIDAGKECMLTRNLHHLKFAPETKVEP